MSEDLPEKLRRIEIKLDSIKKMLRQYILPEGGFKPFPLEPSGSHSAIGENVESRESSVNIYLFKLPDSLRKTMFAMNWFREATAYQVARATGRSRSVESFHLNQLERMGYLGKLRKGKKVYFKVPRPVFEKDKRFVKDYS